MTDDGTLVPIALATQLKQQGWTVVILSLPRSVVNQQQPTPDGIHRLVLHELSESHLKQQLEKIFATYGSVAAFIHLNPVLKASQSEGIIYHPTERAIAKLVFLLAKHLKPSLTTAAQTGRSYFVTVSRLDGQFGLSHTMNFGAIAAGLFGLTKTLNQEWSSVFCRAIDLHADFDAEQATKRILAELSDPNLYLTEVGYSLQERTTLVCQA